MTEVLFTASEEEESPYDSNDISLKRYSGEDRIFEDVEVVHLMHASGEGTIPYSRGRAVENVPITLDFQNDENQLVAAPDGTLVKSAIIAKPEDLSPENVRYGKVIANVIGEFIGDTEELVVGESEGAVPLDWSEDGTQIITPEENSKSFSKVTIEKPAGLRPENIAKDVVIGGITGTFEGGGGGTTDFDFTDENLKFFSYNIDMENKVIYLTDIFYDVLYATKGSYDVTIPNTIGGYDTVIISEVM